MEILPCAQMGARSPPDPMWVMYFRYSSAGTNRGKRGPSDCGMCATIFDRAGHWSANFPPLALFPGCLNGPGILPQAVFCKTNIP